MKIESKFKKSLEPIFKIFYKNYIWIDIFEYLLTLTLGDGSGRRCIVQNLEELARLIMCNFPHLFLKYLGL